MTGDQTETMALFRHSREVPTNTAEGNRTSLRAEGARDFLLDFDHAEILFGPIIRERDSEITQEEQDGVSIALKPIQEILGFGLLDSPPMAGHGQRWGLGS